MIRFKITKYRNKNMSAYKDEATFIVPEFTFNFQVLSGWSFSFELAVYLARSVRM